MATTLKKLLKEAHALLSQEHGSSTLYDLLKQLVADTQVRLTGFQATVAAASIGGFVADKAMTLKELRTRVGTCGTAGNTTVQVHKNGVAISGAELTTANDAADGTGKSVALNVAVAVGDCIELVVSAAPTDGADLGVTAVLDASQITVE